MQGLTKNTNIFCVQEVLDKRDPDSVKIKQECVKRLAEMISETMGGRFSSTDSY